jgi:hypothetical protein
MKDRVVKLGAVDEHERTRHTFAPSSCVADAGIIKQANRGRVHAV